MDEVCIFIKSICDVPNPEVYDGCRYIKFNDDEDLNTDELSEYIHSELIKNMGSDVSNIEDRIVRDNLNVIFSYKGFDCEISEKYNSKGRHYWVVSV